jgi:hypothetical protein
VKRDVQNDKFAEWFVKNMINPGFITDVILQNPQMEIKYILISIFREALTTILLKNDV